MDYQSELDRLQRIITSDDSNESQRQQARKAQEMLFESEIEEVLNRYGARTKDYQLLIDKINKIITEIEENKVVNVVTDLNTILESIPHDE